MAGKRSPMSPGGLGAGRFDARAFARTLKRRLVLVAAILFGTFWTLAAGHSVGVTAEQDTVNGPAAQVQQAPLSAQPTPRLFRTSNRQSRAGNVSGGNVAPVLVSGSS